MDIDLLFTGEGEAGLIANGNFVKKAIGVVRDNKSGILTLEYADSDYMEFNIPVESDFLPRWMQTRTFMSAPSRTATSRRPIRCR